MANPSWEFQWYWNQLLEKMYKCDIIQRFVTDVMSLLFYKHVPFFDDKIFDVQCPEFFQLVWCVIYIVFQKMPSKMVMILIYGTPAITFKPTQNSKVQIVFPSMQWRLRIFRLVNIWPSNTWYVFFNLKKTLFRVSTKRMRSKDDEKSKFQNNRCRTFFNIFGFSMHHSMKDMVKRRLGPCQPFFYDLDIIYAWCVTKGLRHLKSFIYRRCRIPILPAVWYVQEGDFVQRETCRRNLSETEIEEAVKPSVDPYNVVRWNLYLRFKI